MCENFFRWGVSLLALASAAWAATPDKRPNIIFVILDDMRPQHCNFLPEGKGRNLTPHLDRLAAEGTVLSRMHVVSPVCTPSRYNVLTGRYASRAANAFFKETTAKNGGQTVVEFNTHIEPGEATLPSLLRKAGYLTGMVGKNHVVDVPGLKTFSSYDLSASDPANQAVLRENHEKVRKAVAGIGFDFVGNVYHNNPDFLGLREVAVQNMEWLTGSALDFLDQAGGKPFFLYFATTIPHGPTEAARSWRADPRMTSEGPQTPRAVQAPRDSIPQRLKAAGLPVTDDTANILWLDDALGALIGRLEKNRQLDNTLIVFFTDHGQNAKGTLYQGGVLDPAVIWRPGGFPCGGKQDALLSNIDFAPTLLDFAGADAGGTAFDGISFRPQLDGAPADNDRVLYHELGYARAIRKGDWKYLAVRYPQSALNLSLPERKKLLDEWNAERRFRKLEIVTEDPAAPFSHLTAIPGGGHAESESTGQRPGYHDADQLYDLAADADEKTNLADYEKHRGKLAEMRAAMASILKTLPGEFPLVLQKPAVDPERLVDPARSHTIDRPPYENVFTFRDDLFVHSNLWGLHAMQGQKPPFSYTLDGAAPFSPVTFRWSIARPLPPSRPIFPYVGIGDRLWSEKPASTTSRLPVRLGDLQRCVIRYDIDHDREAFEKAKGNIAIDVWLGSQPKANGDAQRREIMFWFNRREQWPLGWDNPRGTFLLSGRLWDLYAGTTGSGTAICTFIAQDPGTRGEIDFLQATRIVRQFGFLTDDDWLGSVELGNESFAGDGRTTVNNLHLDVLDHGIPWSRLENEWRFHDLPFSKKSFDGSGGLASTQLHNHPAPQRTIAMRVRPADIRSRQVLYTEGKAVHAEGQSHGGLAVYIEDGKIHLSNWGAQGAPTFLSASLPEPASGDGLWSAPGVWLNVAVLADGDKLSLWIDGRRVASGVYQPLPRYRHPTHIGGNGEAVVFPDGESAKTHGFRGVIDDVFVFNVALAAGQIERLR